ncbi:hypothetical protein PGT21_004671 [Puccinia graminis f. sp. tritici]|uniref:DUF7143 domain-containing protein n=1 Tax=Puccinia graminis f. sp. tritici TaxID=56615 RepID=A0A5B0PKG0_PUCGR|nr:hypothetical protein PGT21_004671 [Puccinia graminis f. sp. tritici]
MKSNINLRVFILLIAGSFSETWAQAVRPCFITGNVPLPASVTYDPSVQCDLAIKPFPDVPDVYMTVNQVTYRFSQRDISYQSSADIIPPVIFAVRSFGVMKAADKLEVYGKLYGAINAGVRSQGNKAATQLTKGVQSFIQLHLRKLAGDPNEKLYQLFRLVRKDSLCFSTSKISKDTY